MIVEDQVILAMDLEMVLTDAGCDVVGCALDREGAFGVGERERPNLAFVDVNLLDGRTGPQIARRLVEEYGTAVVFLTANPEQIPEGFAGALGAVTKPFDENTIRAVVSFAREFIFLHTVGKAPCRLQLAPWLAMPPQDAAHH